jgi:hypothetical protein
MATLYTAYRTALCDRFAGASQLPSAIQFAQIEKSATGLDATLRAFVISSFRDPVFLNHENTKGRKHEMQEHSMIVLPRISRFRTFALS